MISREQAVKLLHENMQNINLRKHCYAVEVVMRTLAKRLEEDEETWGIAGLLHDADYEVTKDKAEKEHTKQTLKWLKELEVQGDIYDAIASHAWNFVASAPQPRTKMEWALYCCDELTGLIVAVALVKPDKRLASVTTDSIIKKWHEKSFAKGVKREQIEECEPRLGIPLKEFIQINLEAMQGISKDLGL